MVTREYIEQQALYVYKKKHNAMAKAFLDALGVVIVPMLGTVGTIAGALNAGVYSDLWECFQNRESIMDRPDLV